jgi:hypothetical protein
MCCDVTPLFRMLLLLRTHLHDPNVSMCLLLSTSLFLQAHALTMAQLGVITMDEPASTRSYSFTEFYTCSHSFTPFGIHSHTFHQAHALTMAQLGVITMDEPASTRSYSFTFSHTHAHTHKQTHLKTHTGACTDDGAAWRHYHGRAVSPRREWWCDEPGRQ